MRISQVDTARSRRIRPANLTSHGFFPLQRAVWNRMRRYVRAWWSASDPTAITLQEGRVVRWADPFGIGLHMVQPTPDYRPLWDPVGWDGVRPAVRFDPVSTTARAMNGENGAFLNERFSWLAAVRYTAVNALNAGGSRGALFTSGGPVGGMSCYCDGPSNRWMHGFNGSGPIVDGRTVPQKMMFGVHFSGNRWRVNGADNNDATLLYYYNYSRATIGSLVETSAIYAFNGWLADLVCLSASTPLDVYQWFEGLVAQRLASTVLLAADHPYKTVPPRV